jgi:hypothetical protein
MEVARAPLRRLTRREYDNAVRDLLGDSSRPAKDFIDESVAGFAANSVAPVSVQQLTQYRDAARLLASTAVQSQLDGWVSCDTADSACIAPLLAGLAKRAFRRPAGAETEAALVSLYEAGRDQWGADKGVELALQAILLAPQFLYHIEIGTPADGAIVPLDGYEIAARLSFTLWQSIPDDALFAAAEAGELGTPEGIEAQARRMLADRKIEGGLDSFVSQWLWPDPERDPELLAKDPATFPAWTPSLGPLMKAETLAFSRAVILEEQGSLATLLTAPWSYIDDALAPIYGVAPSGGAARVDFDPAERAGLLTQASFLASNAGLTQPNEVLRGKVVREALLCDVLPPPPANAMDAQVADRLADPACRACHLRMDPIGMGFARYDAMGGYVASAGDDAGEVVDGGDASGVFHGPVELAGRLAQSTQVHECFSRQWLRYALRRGDAVEDGCSRTGVAHRFSRSGLDVGELIMAVVTSDAFRYRAP